MAAARELRYTSRSAVYGDLAYDLDRAALERVHDPAPSMWVPLALLTAAGVALALCSNSVIGFLWTAVQRVW